MLISGPISLNIVSSGNKLFYIFGDEHKSKNDECPPEESISIVDLLDVWVRNNERNEILCDIYTETPIQIDSSMKVSDEELQSQWITTIYDRFHDCFDMRCDIMFTRFHNVDIRFSLVGNGAKIGSIFLIPTQYISKLFSLMDRTNYRSREEVSKVADFFLDMFIIQRHIVLNALYYFDIECNSTNFIRDINNSLIFKGAIKSDFKVVDVPLIGRSKLSILGRDLANFLDTLTLSGITDIDSNTNYSRTGYQLTKISDEIRNKIYTFTRSKIEDLVNRYKLIINDDFLERMKFIAKNKYVIDPEDLFEMILKTFEIINKDCIETIIGARLMDVYLLSLIMSNDDSIEIITYTGDNHSEHYVDFLVNEMDGIILESADVIGKRCVSSELIIQKLE